MTTIRTPAGRSALLLAAVATTQARRLERNFCALYSAAIFGAGPASFSALRTFGGDIGSS